MNSPAVLNDTEFDKVRDLIYGRVGIKLADSKRAMVFGRLSRRLRQLKITCFRDYLGQLDDPDAEEWQFFTNALTTNLTSFFREAHHFDALADYLRSHKDKPLVRIWCTAASTGEEPYSIAMVVAEVGKDGPRAVEILASDVDTHVLEHGVHGIYGLDRIEKLDKRRIRHFFLRGTGPNEGFCKVRPELRKMIQFQRINLLDARWPVPDKIDVIFCRNVMIYFDKETQCRLIQHFVQHMHADSLFIAGHSESFYHCAQMLKSEGRTVFRKAGP